MRIATCSPYGFNDCEAGLIFLAAAYLKHLGVDVSQVVCDGVCTTCARDQVVNWQRSLSSCLGCTKEQLINSSWGEFEAHHLSRYIDVESTAKIERILLGTSDTGIIHSEYDGMLLMDFVRDNFYERFSRDEPDPRNGEQTKFLRDLMISTVRIINALRKFCVQWKPDYIFVADTGEMFVRVIGKVAKDHDVKAAIVTSDREKRTSAITHPSREMVLTCDMLFSDLTSMRRDCSTWPREMVDLLQEVLNFLGFFEKDVPGVRRVG